MLAFSAESYTKRTKMIFPHFLAVKNVFSSLFAPLHEREALRDIIITEAKTNKNENYSSASNSVNFFFFVVAVER
jgi:hypothetical protein